MHYTRAVYVRWIHNLTLLLACWTASSYGDAFSVQNFHPLAQLYGLPIGGYEANTRTAGEMNARLIVHHSNFFTTDATPTENVLFDGESRHMLLTLEGGIIPRLQLGITLPYVMHRGGVLDGFINDWHDFFGLSEGGRNAAPKDLYRVVYENDGETSVNGHLGARGVCDLRLHGAWQCRTNLTLHASVKLPTGDDRKILGSGGMDVGSWLASQTSTRCLGHDVLLQARGGILYLGDGKIIPDQQRNWVGFGGASTTFKCTQNFGLIAQLDAHTALYSDSELDQIGYYSAVLTLGGIYRWRDDWQLKLGVAEDLRVSASPDVGFHFELSASF